MGSCEMEFVCASDELFFFPVVLVGELLYCAELCGCMWMMYECCWIMCLYSFISNSVMSILSCFSCMGMGVGDVIVLNPFLCVVLTPSGLCVIVAMGTKGGRGGGKSARFRPVCRCINDSTSNAGSGSFVGGCIGGEVWGWGRSCGEEGYQIDGVGIVNVLKSYCRWVKLRVES